MAKVLISNVHNNQVGSVDFMFTENHTESYLFVDIDADVAAAYQLEECTVRDATCVAIATLRYGSNGKDCLAEVLPAGSHRAIGRIRVSTALALENGQWNEVGYVSDQYVTRHSKGGVGQVSMQWTTADEDFYWRRMQDYANNRKVPTDRARALLEQRRSDFYQNMMNFTGCTALIMNLV